MIKHITTTPAKALEKLKAGNARYIDAMVNSEDISQAKRTDTLVNGQKPYAIIITCSDSRVIPENIFMTGIGELFVIRIAGNVIDEHQLGSIEYAASHLGAPLIVVMGHTHCAVRCILQSIMIRRVISNLLRIKSKQRLATSATRIRLPA